MTDVLKFDYRLPFKKPTFEKFFSHEQLKEIADNAHAQVFWDFNSDLGDTIKEKYEALYVKVIEVNSLLIAKGAKGYFWIATSPELASIFETCCWHNFSPPKSYDTSTLVGDIFPQGMPSIMYCGAVAGKWRLYKDTELSNELIIGCNDTMEDYSHYARLIVENFI